MTQDDKAPVPGWVEKASKEYFRKYTGEEWINFCEGFGIPEHFQAGALAVLERAKKLEEALDNLQKSEVIRTAQYITYSEAFLNAQDALSQWRKEMGVDG